MASLQSNTGSLFSHLVCSKGGEHHDMNGLVTHCTEHNATLVAQYNTAGGLDRRILEGREWNMWRYREMLPVQNEANIITLGEGMKPLWQLKQLSQELGVQVYFKDESQNPGNSFKALGQSAAISRAVEFGAKAVIIPTAGNAGSAMAQYAAAAGLRAIVFMPANTPQEFIDEAKAYGAEVQLIDGDISVCGAEVRKLLESQKGILDISTFKEPFRLEGKKTMGYDIAAQMGWEMPDVILYPTGGGTGLVGIWKAVQEMQALGWLESDKTPRMVAVQMEQCAPVVNTFLKNPDATEVEPVQNPGETASFGLRVPVAFAGNLIMQTLRESHGNAVAVPEGDIKTNAETLRRFGLQVGPESASLLTALHKLCANDWIRPGEKVVMLSTGGHYKYMEPLGLKAA